jgi:hypothetical protein
MHAEGPTVQIVVCGYYWVTTRLLNLARTTPEETGLSGVVGA